MGSITNQEQWNHDISYRYIVYLLSFVKKFSRLWYPIWIPNGNMPRVQFKNNWYLGHSLCYNQHSRFVCLHNFAIKHTHIWFKSEVRTLHTSEWKPHVATTGSPWSPFMPWIKLECSYRNGLLSTLWRILFSLQHVEKPSNQQNRNVREHTMGFNTHLTIK